MDYNGKVGSGRDQCFGQYAILLSSQVGAKGNYTESMSLFYSGYLFFLQEGINFGLFMDYGIWH
jgi:hypothetical protein